jgi:phosphate transport system permease protein
VAVIGLSHADRTRNFDRYSRALFFLCAALLVLVAVSIPLFLAVRGVATFRDVNLWNFLTGTTWEPDASPPQYGALPFIAGSLAVTALAIVIATPLSIGAAVFATQLAPLWAQRALTPALTVLVGIPSVVYGWIGLTILRGVLETVFNVTPAQGVLLASLVLSVMVLPTIASVSIDNLRSVHPSLREASLALGATRWQTIWHVLLPAARTGLLTGVIFGFGRAIGETLAVGMVIGAVPNLPSSLFGSTSTLTVEIFSDMGDTTPGTTWNNALFAMGLLLLIVSFLLITVVRLIGRNQEVVR